MLNGQGLEAQLAHQLGGERVARDVQAATLTFPPGQAGLPTQRLVLQLQARAAGGDSVRGDYSDGNYADRLGWQEVIVVAAGKSVVSASTAPAQDISRELPVYPADLPGSPPQTSRAALTWQKRGGARCIDGTTRRARATVTAKLIRSIILPCGACATGADNNHQFWVGQRRNIVVHNRYQSCGLTPVTAFFGATAATAARAAARTRAAVAADFSIHTACAAHPQRRIATHVPIISTVNFG